MLTKHRADLARVGTYLTTFLTLTFRAALIGLACGVVGAAFHRSVDLAGELFSQYDWLLYLLPVSGLAIVGLYHLAGVRRDRGTNLVLESIQSGQPVAVRFAPLIFVSTILTHLCGGSAGREGAALQIGAGLSACFNKLFRLEGERTRVVTMCGMAGLFGAVFGTPVTAAVFSMEVGTVGILRYAALYPCLFSSLTAWEVSRLLGGTGVRFTLSAVPEATLPVVLRVVVLALLCALCSILFLKVMHGAEHLYHKIGNQYLRVALGGILIIAATLLLGTRDYNGAGMAVITRAIAGEAVPYAFLLKILFTALTIGAGFKGGEIVPTFFIGATIGCAVGPLLGLDPGFAAAVGLVALFCCVVNCPMASILLALELFGGEGTLLFALACGLCYIMSGYYTLYAQQRIVYSKLGEEPKG